MNPFGGPLICYTTYTFEFIGAHLKLFEVIGLRLHATVAVDGERWRRVGDELTRPVRRVDAASDAASDDWTPGLIGRVNFFCRDKCRPSFVSVSITILFLKAASSASSARVRRGLAAVVDAPQSSASVLATPTE